MNEEGGGDCLKQQKATITTKKKKNKRVNWGLWMLACPGLIFLITFYYLPLYGLVIPFKQIDYAKGIWGSNWVGFKNFEFFFGSQDAFRTTRNTICYNLAFIFITIGIALVLALLMYNLTKNQVKVYQTALFIPYFISWVVASYILYALLSPQLGVIPNLMEKFGASSPNFYYETKWWPIILVLAYLWKNVGYMTLMFYAALIGIDSSQFEAAKVDGANQFQVMTKIAIPFIRPVVIMMILLQIGKIFNSDFGMFYFLTRNSGPLYPVTDVIDTYVYRALRVTGNMGMAAAAGLYQSVMGFIVVMGSNLLIRRIDKDSALF